MDRGDAVAQFVYGIPALDSYWRAIVLFGRNVASYKFALAGALLEVGADSDTETVSLEQLALPFATRVAEHLRHADKQGTSPSSKFLDACRSFNLGELDADALRAEAVRRGFVNVIDAFHYVDDIEVPQRFFIDERRMATAGLRITDNLNELLAQGHGPNLRLEAESRWRLVETAWELNLPRRLLTVEFEPVSKALIVPDRIDLPNKRRRAKITAARDILGGYQKGHCFYCYAPIDISSECANPCEVDHFFAWSAGDLVGGALVDGVWNLVLACSRCNGWHEKSDHPPHQRYVDRLNQRNETLIKSDHPLRATLIAQTGQTPEERAATIRRAMEQVSPGGARERWIAPEEFEPAF